MLSAVLWGPPSRRLAHDTHTHKHKHTHTQTQTHTTPDKHTWPDPAVDSGEDGLRAQGSSMRGGNGLFTVLRTGSHLTLFHFGVKPWCLGKSLRHLFFFHLGGWTRATAKTASVRTFGMEYDTNNKTGEISKQIRSVSLGCLATEIPCVCICEEKLSTHRPKLHKRNRGRFMTC